MKEIKAITNLREFVRKNYTEGHKWLYRLDLVVEFTDNTPFPYMIDLRFFEMEVKRLKELLSECTNHIDKVKLTELSIGVM